LFSSSGSLAEFARHAAGLVAGQPVHVVLFREITVTAIVVASQNSPVLRAKTKVIAPIVADVWFGSISEIAEMAMIPNRLFFISSCSIAPR
jgi:hypothetical protein